MGSSNHGGLASPYLVFAAHGEWTHAYLHVRTGQGKATRRRLLDSVWVPVPLTRDRLPDVLREVARQLSLPPGDRRASPP